MGRDFLLTKGRFFFKDFVYVDFIGELHFLEATRTTAASNLRIVAITIRIQLGQKQVISPKIFNSIGVTKQGCHVTG